MASAPRHPVSTYRLQFTPRFTFRDAAQIVPYLAQLGITDCYCSPYLRARPGSTHGYDICDHGELNPELGTAEDYDAFVAALKAHGMGQILDIVPNHMSIDAQYNAWWWDVLAHGPHSAYAHYFDIDWDPVKPELCGKVLLPILGDRYGHVLERGELQLVVADTEIQLAYHEQRLPVRAGSVTQVLGRDDVTADEAVRQLNGQAGTPDSFDQLHALLEQQYYRLAAWQTAAHEINYRRFFDINGLAALRMEAPDVFAATHPRVLSLIRDGHVTGLRLDHPDGLHDPDAYCHRLQDAVRHSADWPRQTGAPALYVVVEKILTADEPLRPWPVHGTTGYDFLNQLNGVFVHGAAGPRLQAIYAEQTGKRVPYPILQYVCKKLITHTSLASELNVLAHALNRLSEADRRSRDFTLTSLRDALQEVVACFPLYRTYMTPTQRTPADTQTIALAIARALKRNPAMEPSIFGFLRDVFVPQRDMLSVDAYEQRVALTMKLQQYTAPVHAKGVEDTAFYRHHVLISLNEVGGEPERLGCSVDDFHAHNIQRAQAWPASMLCTGTHDTKRGEDARARINVISELPAEWAQQVTTWSRMTDAARQALNGDAAPDRNDIYLLYQTLVGVWPTGPRPPMSARRALVQRVQTYMQKAVREAKVHTSWMHPQAAYERAVAHMVEQILTGAQADEFLDAFEPWHQRIAAAGMVNGLAQLVLKMISPGVADFYQGTELWDYRLVDPDNRQPVDYAQQQQWLTVLAPVLTAQETPQATAARRQIIGELLAHWSDGRIKMCVTTCGLRLRRAWPDVFVGGAYTPLEVSGTHHEHVVACLRQHNTRTALAVVPRLVASLTDAAHPIPVGERCWGTTAVTIPASVRATTWQDVCTGERFTLPTGDAPRTLLVGALLQHLPVALLRAETLGDPV